ncbi:MAG: hypothetical protein ACRDT6_13060 [Micromonosporaceae bacterium]
MTSNNPTYADVVVQLSGTDGNAFTVIARVTQALRQHADHEAATTFSDAAFSCGSYDQVLDLAMRTVTVL